MFIFRAAKWRDQNRSQQSATQAPRITTAKEVPIPKEGDLCDHFEREDDNYCEIDLLGWETDNAGPNVPTSKYALSHIQAPIQACTHVGIVQEKVSDLTCQTLSYDARIKKL